MNINLFSLAAAGVLFWWISVDIMLERHRKKYLQICIALTMAVIGAELGCVLTDNTIPELRMASMFFNAVGFGVSPFVFLAEAECYRSSDKDKKFSKALLYPAFINLIFVVLSPAKGYIFYVTEDCVYMRGQFYIVYLAAFIFSVCWSGIKKLQVASNVPDYFRRRIISSEIILGAGLLLQVVFPQFHTTWIIVTICLILFYALSCQMDSILDGLTSLLNRAAFNNVIERIFGNERSFKSDMTLMMLDINDFKRINDRRGHNYGDYCLQQIAEILKQTAPKGSQVFRYGGDEFTAILPVTAAEAESIKTELDEAVKKRRRKEPDFPEIAAGFARLKKGFTIAEVMNAADRCMYEDKNNKKKQ